MSLVNLRTLRAEQESQLEGLREIWEAACRSSLNGLPLDPEAREQLWSSCCQRLRRLGLLGRANDAIQYVKQAGHRAGRTPWQKRRRVAEKTGQRDAWVRAREEERFVGDVVAAEETELLRGAVTALVAFTPGLAERRDVQVLLRRLSGEPPEQTMRELGLTRSNLDSLRKRGARQVAAVDPSLRDALFPPKRLAPWEQILAAVAQGATAEDLQRRFGCAHNTSFNWRIRAQKQLATDGSGCPEGAS